MRCVGLKTKLKYTEKLGVANSQLLATSQLVGEFQRSQVAKPPTFQDK